jgi:predicted AAA+ superfamily ATPase
MDFYPRTLTAILRSTAAQRPAVLLTGCRQTGKSSLLHHSFPKCTYVTLDLPLVAEEAQQSGADFLDRHAPPVIIDEIQYAPELLRHVKVRIDTSRAKSGQYFLTGSQKFPLMAGVSESLAGRVAVMNLHSLSLEELEGGTGLTAEGQQLSHWLVQGGYPELHARGLDARRFYSDYTATYLERDVRQLIQVRDLRDFERLLRLLAVRSGQLLSLNTLASEIGISVPTVKSWLTALEASNVIMMLPPWHGNVGKRLVKSPKVYFLDTGLMCFLANIHTAEALRQSPLLGAFFETLALGQWLRGRHHRALDDQIFFYRDHEGHEVDFVVPEGDRLHLLECKWAELPDRPKVFPLLEKLAGPGKIASCSIITPSRQKRRLPKSGFDAVSPVESWKIGT